MLPKLLAQWWVGGALLHLSVSGDMDVSAADLQQLSVEHLLWLISTAVLILRQKLGFSDNWEFVNPDPVGYQQRPGQGANIDVEAPPPVPSAENLREPFICGFRCAHCAERCTRNTERHGHHRCYRHRRY